MIDRKKLEDSGFFRRETLDPVSKAKYIRYRKGMIEVFIHELFNPKKETWEIITEKTFIKIPENIPWEKEMPLHHIRETSQILKLDQILNV